MSEFDFLEEQGVSAALIKAAEEFRQEYGVSEEAKRDENKNKDERRDEWKCCLSYKRGRK